jgi:hypothetical protein
VATSCADLAESGTDALALVVVVSPTTIMSHALLLRLFLSPSYFSVHVALHYLMLYSDNIGITYYLTRRLREFTIDELRDVWGFIW